MNRTIPIFKKDVRHLWMQILVFVAMLVLFACEDPTYVKHERNTVVGERGLLYLLLPLSCWLLVTSLMQEEKTVGHNQYWLTRPFSSADLLGAKALFLLAFVIAPVLVCQLVVLGVNGFPPGQYFGAMLVKQIYFLAWLLLPMAAVATVTKNLGHAFLAGLLLPVAIFLGLTLLSSFGPDSGWGGLEWIFVTGMAAIALCTSGAVVYLQYTRRRTALSRAFLAGGAAVLLLSAFLPPLQPAFAIQSWFSTREIPPDAVRISFDPGGVVTRAGAKFSIPIRVENIPPSLYLASDWVSIESPRRMGWADLDQDALKKNSLVLRIASDDYDRFKNVSIHLRGSLDLTLTAPGAGRSEFVRCGHEGWNSNYCLSPLPIAVVTRQNATIYGYAPYPISPWFGSIQKYPMPGASLDEPVIGTVVAHIQRSFDLGPLRLADAVVVQ